MLITRARQGRLPKTQPLKYHFYPLYYRHKCTNACSRIHSLRCTRRAFLFVSINFFPTKLSIKICVRTSQRKKKAKLLQSRNARALFASRRVTSRKQVDAVLLKVLNYLEMSLDVCCDSMLPAQTRSTAGGCIAHQSMTKGLAAEPLSRWANLVVPGCAPG